MLYYPKELFSINETVTAENIRQYDRARDEWYRAAEKLFPDYHKMNLREKMEKREEINNYVGYSI